MCFGNLKGDLHDPNSHPARTASTSSSALQTATTPVRVSHKNNHRSEPHESFFTRHPMIASESHPWVEYNPATGQPTPAGVPAFTATGNERADPNAPDPRSKAYTDAVKHGVEERKATEKAAEEKKRLRSEEKERRKEEKWARKTSGVVGV